MKCKRAAADFLRGRSTSTWFRVDRKQVFPLRIFVKQSAVEKWGRSAGRALSGTEEYAVAKLRLFQALDESQEIEPKQPDLIVDDSNLDALLSQLDL